MLVLRVGDIPSLADAVYASLLLFEAVEAPFWLDAVFLLICGTIELLLPLTYL